MHYPYSRSEECSWHPEEASRKLYSLHPDNFSKGNLNNNSGSLNDFNAGHQSTSSTVTTISTSGPDNSTKTTCTTTRTTGKSSNVVNDESCYYSNILLSRGWKANQISALRALYGKNSLKNSDDESELNENSRFRFFYRLMSTPPCNTLKPILTSFVSQMKEPLILMLLASAGLSILLGNAADAISISVALTIVSLVAAVQEYRSEQALEKLNDLVADTCTVIRDGQIMDNFLTENLVVGDLLVLSTGDRVPADCRLVDAIELFLDESSLTGENHPVSKSSQAIAPSTQNPVLTDQTNICFMGSLVVNGRGRALVVAVGENTEFGKVHQELSQVEDRKSPLQLKIDELGKILAFTSSAAIAVIAMVGWIMGRPFLETVTVAVSLAVAAIPEGLPICVAVTLALGVLRMAKMNAIVKKLTAVEALGCTTVIASDKTGTLTQNEMTARSVYTLAFPNSCFHLTGVGYETSKENSILIRSTASSVNWLPDQFKSKRNKKEVQTISDNSPEYSALTALFGVATICNNAALKSSNSVCNNSGQPTELALLVGGKKFGLVDPRPIYHREQEIPFSSERKRMEVKARPVSGIHICNAFTTACQTKQNIDDSSTSSIFSHTSYSSSSVQNNKLSTTDESLYFVKGMPEAVIGECKTYTDANGSASPLQEKGKTRILAQSRKMAASGLRVLAMAYGATLDNLTFAGIIGLEDPPREGVTESIQKLRRGGVKVLMVTGDSKETALAIANRCGIFGPEISGYSMDGSYVDPELDCDIYNQKAKEPFEFDDIELATGNGFAMSGEDLDNIPSRNLSDSILGVRVFYRVAPRHKLMLVRALQSQDEIVSMTGDGVNDATALKVSLPITFTIFSISILS